MEYKILSGVFSYDLQEMVNEHIQYGWTPLGGVCYGKSEFHQAMTRQKITQWTVTTTPLGSETTTVSLNEINERMLAR